MENERGSIAVAARVAALEECFAFTLRSLAEALRSSGTQRPRLTQTLEDASALFRGDHLTLGVLPELQGDAAKAAHAQYREQIDALMRRFEAVLRG